MKKGFPWETAGCANSTGKGVLVRWGILLGEMKETIHMKKSRFVETAGCARSLRKAILPGMAGRACRMRKMKCANHAKNGQSTEKMGHARLRIFYMKQAMALRKAKCACRMKNNILPRKVKRTICKDRRRNR